MSQQFIRCIHCGLPHKANEGYCPFTQLPMRSESHRQAPSPPGVLCKAIRTRGQPHDLPATMPSLIGQVVDQKYLIRTLLGKGGMGAVYEAEHLVLGSYVALKVVHLTYANHEVVIQRFHHEARVAGAFNHPNICKVYDVGNLNDGRPYLIMERLVGETLASRLRVRSAMNCIEFLDIAIQILSALTVTHNAGVIHRDIKPENIFLSSRMGCTPVVKLLDFGISKVPSRPTSGLKAMELTQPGMVMGTPAYMAPEQAYGDKLLDHRADLYAVGVILYESITGQRPFLAKSDSAMLKKIVTETPVSVRQICPNLAPELVELVERAMTKDRKARFQTAGDFLEATICVRNSLLRAALLSQKNHKYFSGSSEISMVTGSKRIQVKNELHAVAPWGNEKEDTSTTGRVGSDEEPPAVGRCRGLPPPTLLIVATLVSNETLSRALQHARG